MRSHLTLVTATLEALPGLRGPPSLFHLPLWKPSCLHSPATLPSCGLQWPNASSLRAFALAVPSTWTTHLRLTHFPTAALCPNLYTCFLVPCPSSPSGLGVPGWHKDGTLPCSALCAQQESQLIGSLQLTFVKEFMKGRSSHAHFMDGKTEAQRERVRESHAVTACWRAGPGGVVGGDPRVGLHLRGGQPGLEGAAPGAGAGSPGGRVAGASRGRRGQLAGRGRARARAAAGKEPGRAGARAGRSASHAGSAAAAGAGEAGRARALGGPGGGGGGRPDPGALGKQCALPAPGAWGGTRRQWASQSPGRRAAQPGRGDRRPLE